MSIKHNSIELPKSKEIFLQQYWLKSQLIQLSKNLGLLTIGSKKELTNQISNFIENKISSKTKIIKKTKKRKNILDININTLIDSNYKNDENHRKFFIEKIGKKFKYNIPFMKWMNKNKGIKTYDNAISKWLEIKKEKKNGKKNKISPQFEYNQYVRDFFRANPNLTKENCIKCWNYKKSILGSHKYEKNDLKILSDFQVK